MRFVDSSVSAGATYYYRVIAYEYGVGKGESSETIEVVVPGSSASAGASSSATAALSLAPDAAADAAEDSPQMPPRASGGDS